MSDVHKLACTVLLVLAVSLAAGHPPAGLCAREPAVGLLLVVSGNTQGVLEPCGCQASQGGGLARRATLLRSLRREHPGAVFLDAGNLVARLAPNRHVLKEARAILKDQGYAAGVIGPAELGLGPQALREASTGAGLALAISDVRGAAGEGIGRESVPAAAGAVTLELFTVITSSLVPKDYVCRDAREALASGVRAAVARGHAPVLVSYQPLSELRELLKALPEVRLAFASSVELSGGPPERVGAAWVVPAPASGRELRVLRVFLSQGAVSEVACRTVDVGPSIAPDAGVAARIRAFYERHRLGGLEGPPVLSPQSAARVQGLVKEAARECGSCHEQQQRHWAESRHAHAWLILQQSSAQARAECVGCHTTPLLAASLGSSSSGVGCATCHGDGFQHAAQPRKPGLISRVPAERVCAQCHTAEASPHFEYPKWLRVVEH